MATLEINNIELITNDDEIITLTPNMYKNFYLANLDENGEEINYEVDNEYLKANFLLLKILSSQSIQEINFIKNNKNITKLNINFKNGLSQKFLLSKRRIAVEGKLINKYEETIENENDLCLLITNLNIKYKKELFA